VKLKHLEKWTAVRQELAREYDEKLAGIPGLVLPSVAPGATHVYHVYVIRTKRRDALQEYLQKQGIGTLIHYPVPPHLQKAYVGLGYKEGDFPIAEEIARTALSLPLWPGMTSVEMNKIISSIVDFFKG